MQSKCRELTEPTVTCTIPISALMQSSQSLSFPLFTFTYCSVHLPKGEKNLLILLCSSRIWVRFFFFFFFFAEAGSHFISLITYLSLPLHIRKLLTNILLVYFSDLLHIHRSSRIWVGKIAVLYTCSAINFCGTQ